MRYIFFRKDGWYPLELDNDQEMKDNVRVNTDIVKVENIYGEIVWEKKIKKTA